MDETDVRTMLRGLADTLDGPARIDLPLAAQRGWRSRRWRNMRMSGSALAIGAVAGIVAAILVFPDARTIVQAPEISTSAPAAAPAQFDALVPYASFGWLPAGYSAPELPQDTSSTQDVSLSATKGGSIIMVDVWAAGSCTDSGTSAQPELTCKDGAGESSTDQGTAVSVRAPDVHGRPAYWESDGGSFVGLRVEYAPNAWFTVGGTTIGRSAMVRIAANIRFGTGTPIRFPFWASLSGLPADWRVQQVTYSESPGYPIGGEVLVGPASVPYALNIEVEPGTLRQGCPDLEGQPREVNIGGTDIAFREIVGSGGRLQGICVADSGGMTISVTIAPGAPGAARFGSAWHIASELHLLPGTDPAVWTADPLR
ncbi:MAG TPA: hypothetical protein VN969_23380 [Streptosporangiaceae bacterium]|nr:hypothetical protein [Streptosporangiaceae bacterium]